MKFDVTYTDTFGGEANYSWTRKATIEAPEDCKNSLLVRRAKAALGINGRSRTEDWGDCVAIYPQGECTVVFVSIANNQE